MAMLDCARRNFVGKSEFGRVFPATMSVHSFTRTVSLGRSARDVFAWHERPSAFERLCPPWEAVRVLEASGGIQDGGRLVMRGKLGLFHGHCELNYFAYDEPWHFSSRMKEGPFAEWEHDHQFEQHGPAACTLTDTVRYRLPLGWLGNLAHPWAQRRLDRLFAYRHEMLIDDLEMAADYGAVRSMRFLVTGASGLVGRALVPFLRSQGHEVWRLVRQPAKKPDEIFWDPERGELDLTRQPSFDVVVHLAGAGIAAGRWTASRRREIEDSRLRGTRTLVDALERLEHRPFVLVTASAVGFYGATGDRDLYEDGPRGEGFLAGVCDAWEQEAFAAENLGLRVVPLRFGVVLSPLGGALGRLLPVFSAGLGGRLGSGRQWMSWVAIDDVLGAIYHAVLDQRCNGPVNVVAPEPVTNQEFCSVLARVLKRPAVLPVPGVALRLLFGSLADETLLASARVRPGVLQETLYRFRHPDLEGTLRHLLGRPA